MKVKNVCKRCNISKKYLYECCRCEEKICYKCVTKIYPEAKIDKEELNNAKNNVLTDYCYYGCNTNLKYCNDCGKNYKTIKRCKGCFIALCYGCKKKKTDSQTLNISLSYAQKYELANYCNLSCYIIHTNFDSNKITNCQKCYTIFINPYSYKKCMDCRLEDLVENNIKKNLERKNLQKKLKKYLDEGKVEKNKIIKYAKKKMTEYIEKYNKINENNVTLEQWLCDTDSGNNSCLNLWDFCIDKYLN